MGQGDRKIYLKILTVKSSIASLSDATVSALSFVIISAYRLIDSIHGLGPLKVSRGSQIHKRRNISFGITQMHFWCF